ncbi:HAMP domain-containing histidine kinase [Planosporangium flavigriseum]|uniref:histidine kinase n=1 Tax=Planosporangium flavigriseum TaxID=373681 RepID=A0A8J3PPB2_9ACTN|nr:HAMP domain-containing sensor histidine kinase [Planosporangium flavigriseum]NJC66709.1 HAMP domain-containing histidine kinase [Planosporangium flavigriseum]GIG74861.1 two-component sensor histidine kinase [Planosporangium flavigriseum]
MAAGGQPPPARTWPGRGLLARTPLRVKLVTAVLALVTAALVITGAASALALRSYLVDRIDSQLTDAAERIDVGQLLYTNRDPILPTDYFVAAAVPGVLPRVVYDRSSLKPGDLPQLPATLDEIKNRTGAPYTAEAVSGAKRWRVLFSLRPNGQVLVIGQLMTDVDEAMARLIVIDVVVGSVVLVVLAALGVALVRASLRPLVAIERTAAAIAAGQLGRRVPESDPATEVGRLSRVLNTMLAQIEGAFSARAASEQAARTAEAAARDAAAAAQLSEARARRSEERMRQFVADASHELRTPLTTIRGFAELYRQGAVAPDQTGDVLRRIEDEAARMGLLVEDLLLLARLDQERPLILAPVELRVLVSDAAEAAYAIAPNRPITLDAPIGDQPIVVLGDEPRLRQVLGNLVTNALTHTPPASPITLRLSVDDATAVLEVIDNGPGIAPEQADRVFQRFYRVDKARTRQAASGAGGVQAGRHSGAGLGLAIVAALVAAHDGSVEVDSVVGNGATFRVRLPLLREFEGRPRGAALPEISQPDHSSSEASTGIVEA